MTVDTTGAPLMDARNCNAVNKHSLSNTDEYCKIHLKTARCQQNEFVNVSQQYPHNGYREQSINSTLIVFAVNGWVVKYRPLKGLSSMMGNYHVQFLGGEEP
jgi:hypothetical protein